MDTDYAGTYSRVPSRRDESATPSARERRGKYRANRREPRVHGEPHIGLHPDLPKGICVSYRLDENGQPTDVHSFTPKRRKVRARRQTVETVETVAEVKVPETARLSHGHNFND
jgi:hypothetical protein